MKLVPVEEGFDVVVDGMGIGYVFEDAFGGYRPYSSYGKCLNCGKDAFRWAIDAARFLTTK